MTKEDVLRYMSLESPSMKEAQDLAMRVAPSPTTVFVQGPSGSGKEFVARAVHLLSPRAAGPMIAVNCGAIPRELLESELFGSEKGAYTGSVRTRPGLLEAASGGTLFLDEIGDMPQDMQVKLLRVLEERTFMRVGGSQAIALDFRLVCATHRDLADLVEKQQFREDLYYRINVFQIRLRGLDERKEDIPRLVALIQERFKAQGAPFTATLTPPAVEALMAADWPGNVRQLRNVLERCGVLYPDVSVGAAEIGRLLAPRRAVDRREEGQALFAAVHAIARTEEPGEAAASQAPANAGCELDAGAVLRANPKFNLRDRMMQIEMDFIRTALAESGNSVSGAARILGLQRTTLIEKIRKYAIKHTLEREGA